MIEENTRIVFIPIEQEAKDLLFEIKNQGYGKARMRKASQYCVQIYNQLFDTLYGAGIIKEILSEMYTDDKGLNLSVESGMDLYL